VHGQTDLWIVNLVTGTERRLTRSLGTTEEAPDWSPDGRRILFQRDLAQHGNYDIYSIRPDGSGLRRLTRSPAFDADAHFSPNGKSIVFGSDRTGNADVFVMRRNGTGVRRITRCPSFDAYPVSSSDGRSLAFVSERDGGVNDVFRMRLDGTHVRKLTNSPDTHEFEPDWQP
jgi:TolB protein